MVFRPKIGLLFTLLSEAEKPKIAEKHKIAEKPNIAEKLQGHPALRIERDPGGGGGRIKVNLEKVLPIVDLSQGKPMLIPAVCSVMWGGEEAGMRECGRRA